ncbi:MAG: hypothetical protein OXC37_00180 [Bdellovibrionaceae bacterium]|nr:hypothetical protein [Pseudobdellovibrionaceae bacterium]
MIKMTKRAIKINLFFIGSCFLFSCISSEKTKNENLSKSYKQEKFKRDLAYLKQISQVKEDSFQFISSQMKDMIQNYKDMQKQLEKIEQKLDNTLISDSKPEESFSAPVEKDDKTIVLTKKNQDLVTLKLSSIEDYTRVMSQILEGEYDISEEEKKKLLLNLRDQFDEKPTEEINSEESAEFVDIDNFDLDENLDENNSTPGDKTDEFFKEDETSSQLKKDKEDTLMTAKDSFKKQSYESAISEFQKYRNDNPKGIHYPEATFYIGKSFKNLKMPIEAEVFFNELVQSYPETLWASRAKKLLKK